jgi:GNAT superfamily N-acetyltransferase
MDVAATYVRRCLRAVLHWQKLYIVARAMEVDARETHRYRPGPSSIQCEVLETASAVYALEGEFPNSLRDSVGRLARRLDEGCIVFVLRSGDTSSKQNPIIGYSLCQRGVFSAFGHNRKISPDILFGHYFEFVPEYRGLGLKYALDETRVEYCRSHGLKTICGVISSHNIPSLKTSLSKGFRVVGILRQVSVIRGLAVWRTSWKTVEKALYGDRQMGASSIGTPNNARQRRVPARS